MTWALVSGGGGGGGNQKSEMVLAQFISPAGGSPPRVTAWLSTRLSGGSCFRKCCDSLACIDFSLSFAQISTKNF